jgi:hypothetical protein
MTPKVHKIALGKKRWYGGARVDLLWSLQFEAACTLGTREKRKEDVKRKKYRILE